MRTNISFFFFMDHALVLYCFLQCFLWGVSCFTFGSMIHFELIFNKVWVHIEVLFCIWILNYSSTISYIDYSFFIELLYYLCQKQAEYSFVDFFWICFAHSFMCRPSFCQYYTLITIAFTYVLNLGSVSLPILFFQKYFGYCSSFAFPYTI